MAKGRLRVRAVPCLSDNYAWLLSDAETGAVAVCDPGEAGPVLRALRDGPEEGRCDLVLLTHHHADHVAGVAEVVVATGAKVAGHGADAGRLPPLDVALAPGEAVMLGASLGTVIDTPGHARGHVAFHFAEGEVVLCGDTLFSLGCGKLLEGTAAEMFGSLKRLSALPGGTLVCPGHEYTEGNARFALTAEPANVALRTRAEQVMAQRARGGATVPTTLAEELATNPFLRVPDVATLAALRTAKDRFR